MTQACLSILDILPDFAAKHDHLDTEHVDAVPEPNLMNVLNTLWEASRVSYSLAAAAREMQPTPDVQNAVRRGALVASSALASPGDSTRVGLSEFLIDEVRAIYPLTMLPSLSCRDAFEEEEQHGARELSCLQLTPYIFAKRRNDTSSTQEQWSR